MTSLKATDNNFWQNPPWGHGREKFRLGLRPVEHSEWFASDISKELYAYKQDLLKTSYSDVIATTEDSVEAQYLLAKKLNITKKNYPDLVADISLSVPDDLCIIECKGDQRLLAASICSPSYWNIKSKIGKSLKAIHKPVNSLNEKIALFTGSIGSQAFEKLLVLFMLHEEKKTSDNNINNFFNKENCINKT